MSIREEDFLLTPCRAMIRNVGVQMGGGSRLQTAVALASQAYHNRSNTAVGGGACRCHGGSGHCPGCVAIPIYRTMSRLAGLAGKPGREGEVPEGSSMSGAPGSDGRGVIVVKYHSGQRQRYSKCYDLQLVGFDLEDENGDGIFEPGERLFVRRIRIKNAGTTGRSKRTD